MIENEYHIISPFHFDIPTGICGEKLLDFSFQGIDHLFKFKFMGRKEKPCKECLKCILEILSD